jgi:hypothetical protein
MSYTAVKRQDGTYLTVDNQIRNTAGTLVPVSDDVRVTGGGTVTVFSATIDGTPVNVIEFILDYETTFTL